MKEQKKCFCFWLQAFHLLWSIIPNTSPNINSLLKLSHNPLKIEFRLVPFRSPLLRESLLLSFPLVTKMFQFTRFALSSLFIQEVVHEVSSFGYFRIKTCFQFPETFRRQPRPSSLLNTKVSIVSSYSLDFISIQKLQFSFFIFILWR